MSDLHHVGLHVFYCVYIIIIMVYVYSSHLIISLRGLLCVFVIIPSQEQSEPEEQSELEEQLSSSPTGGGLDLETIYQLATPIKRDDSFVEDVAQQLDEREDAPLIS